MKISDISLAHNKSTTVNAVGCTRPGGRNATSGMRSSAQAGTKQARSNIFREYNGIRAKSCGVIKQGLGVHLGIGHSLQRALFHWVRDPRVYPRNHINSNWENVSRVGVRAFVNQREETCAGYIFAPL